jgi:hypothetical protein
MSWFLNFYRCEDCNRVWTDQWSCTCDDECPYCGFRDMTPFNSEDLTELVVKEGDQFVVLRSPETAEHDPDYEELGRFPTREKAEEFLACYDSA